MNRIGLTARCALVMTLSACSGSLSTPGADDVPTGGDGTPGGGGRNGMGGAGAGGSPQPMGPAGITAGAAPLRRLTKTEINNTLEQLLGDTSHAADDLPADVLGDGSGYIAGNNVSVVDAQALADLAARVAGQAAGKLNGLLGCDPSTAGESACAKRFVQNFGKRAFRRPLEDSETIAYVGLFDGARSDASLDFPKSIGLVLQAMLQSPSFLYHWEVGPKGATREGGLVKLGAYELASRLSYFLWQSMPDDDLFAAADTGRLSSAADVEREARRLLGDARAKKTMLDFHRQWLRLGGVAALGQGGSFPAQAAADEVAAFVEHSTFGAAAGGGKLNTLFAAPTGFVNAELGKLYGLPNVTGSALSKVDLDPTQRAGILTQVGFLALNSKGNNSDPIHRGVLVLERVLCEQKPPPAVGVAPAEAPTATKSTREQHLEHESNPVCAGCHASFEPLGFAFENFDGLGKWRAQDGGKSVDASGTVKTPSGETFTFKTAVELAKRIAASPQVHACAAKQLFRFSAGREETDADAKAIDGAVSTFEKNGLDMRELLVALTKSSSFLYRAPSAGEVLQ